MHSHSVQYFELMQVPQQSPPSKLQTSTLVSSLQKPFPTSAFVILFVSPVLHLHFEQNSLLTQGPQQSPPSKEQCRLLLKSWQKPSPISFGNWHSIFEGEISIWLCRTSDFIETIVTVCYASCYFVWNRNCHKILSWNWEFSVQWWDETISVRTSHWVNLSVKKTIASASKYCLSFA